MKKSVKLLVLLLAMVLLCCVFAVSAFAGVGYDYAKHEAATGEILFSYMDFEQTTFVSDKATNFTQSGTSYVNSGSSVKSNNGKNWQLHFANRSGEAWVDSVKQEDNKFLVIWNDKTTLARTGQGAYISAMAYSGTPGDGAGADKNPQNMMYSYQAMVIDYDIKFGEGTVPSGTGINMQLRRYKANGGRDYIDLTGANGGGTIRSLNIFYRMDGDKIKLYTQDSSWNTSTATIPFEEWMHFTIVIDTPIVDNGTPDDTSDDRFQFNIYVYLNDQLVLSSVNKLGYGSMNGTYFYNGNMTNITMSEARWSFGADNVVGASKIALDNFAIRNLDNSYDMTGLKACYTSGDLSTWAGSLYDEDLLPYGVTKAAIEREGKAVEFDNLKEAIAAAQPGEVIKLMANVAEQIEVSNVVTIDKNGYTANLTAANGYAVFDGDTDDVVGNEGTYYSQESSGSLRVMWGACECGDTPSATVNVPLNNNIYDSYFAETGKYPECSYVSDGVLKVLTGWTASGNAGVTGNLSKDAVVTAAMIGKTLRLAPVYTTYTYTAEILNADGTHKAYYYQDSTLGTIIAAAKAGETVKFHSNFDNANDNAQLNVNVDNVTIDLNGYRWADYYVGAASGDKHYTVGVKYNLYIESSRPGATMYHTMYRTSTKSFTGNSFFTAAAAGANVYIDGADDQGNTTLRMYVATVVQGYGSAINCYIDGGEYHRTATDNYAMFDMRAGSVLEVKNAYVNCGARLFRNWTAGTSTVKTSTFENCVIDGTIMDNSNQSINECQAPGLVVSFKGCYINGAVSGATGTTWTIDKGCYLTDSVTLVGVSYAEGVKVVDVNYTTTHSVLTNTYSYKNTDGVEDWGNSLVPYAKEVTATYTKLTLGADAQPVKVTWYDTDGTTVLAVTEDAYAGFKASAPLTEVAGTDGWVRACYTDWSQDAIVPVGVTECSFTLKENSGVTYSAGKVNVMFNFDMTAHYAYSFYVPVAPEGITINNSSYVGACAATGVNPSGSVVTDKEGNKYVRFARWPGANNAGDDCTFNLHYTYNGQALTYTAAPVSAAIYANYIIENEKYEGAPLRTAMADMVRYITSTYALVNKTPNDNLAAIYTKAEAYMTALDDLKTDSIDLSAATTYIDTIEIAYNSGLGALTISVTAKEGYAVGFRPVSAHGMNIIGETRILNNDGIFRAHNIRTWGIAQIFTLDVYEGYSITSNGQTVAFEGEAVASFNYSLAAYLGENMAKLSANEINYVKSIIAYGASAGEYMDWKAQNGIGK